MRQGARRSAGIAAGSARIGTRPAVVAAAIVAAMVAAAPASAATLRPLTLSAIHQTVGWHGRSSDVTGQGYGPPTEQTCTSSTCDSFLLNIRLPKGAMPKGPR